LDEAIKAGKFREDLYYRLKVVTIVVPPLRERKEDIPALIETFIADFNRRNDEKIRGISPQALKLIMEYDWPGNVRELKNAVESSAILATGETIGADAFVDLLSKRPQGMPPSQTNSPPRAAITEGIISIPVGTPLAKVEREMIAATLARYPGRREAAQVLGLGLRTLYTKLRAYGLTG
jgi:DNA-binding NtrC family response regulator